MKQKSNLQPAYSAHILCLTVEKATLDKRIDSRVDKMMQVIFSHHFFISLFSFISLSFFLILLLISFSEGTSARGEGCVE